MTKCKTEGCERASIVYSFKDGDPRRDYCTKCVREFRHLPEAERLKVLAARLAIDELWYALTHEEWNDAVYPRGGGYKR
jgi:hypothetical protein